MFKHSNEGDYFSPLNFVIILYAIIDIIFYPFIDKLVNIEYVSLIVILLLTNAILLAFWKYEKKFKHSIKEKHITLEKILNLEKPFATNITKIKKEDLLTDKDVTKAYWFDLLFVDITFAISNIIITILSYLGFWIIDFSYLYALFNLLSSMIFIFMGVYIKRNIPIILFNKFNEKDELNLKYYFFKDMIVLENLDYNTIKVIPCFDIKKEYTKGKISYNILFENYKKCYFIIDKNGFIEGTEEIVKDKYQKFSIKKLKRK